MFGKRNNKLGITYKTSNQEIQKKVENEVNSQIETAYQVFKTRIDRFGVVQPNIQRVPGTGRIQIELPGVKETDRIKKMLQTSAKLEFWEDIIELYAIKGTQDGKPPLEGSITEAAVNVDPINPSKIMVDMQMDQDGAIKWSSMTKKNQKKPIAVVLDDLVNEPIENGRSQISGNFTQQEAEDLVDVLKSGKLPARATIVQAEVVGPSLGSENIQNGLISALAALLVTFLWLYINYGRSEFGFVLTLPGIAGMVLTLGMSVDANIITNERIKEELRKGKSVPQAVSDVQFRKWQFALGGIAALFHDVIIVLGVFSLFDNILPFSLEIDQGFVAAILTVIGYSINDSVIVFDRIRENLKTHLHMSRLELFNTSLNQVFGRTMNTSVLTFMTVLVMFIFGGEIIRGFMFAILIGIGFGTYSSIYIASSLTFDLLKDSKDKTVK
ncbi:unnamed protein product, partial [Darwinula stevensoni]